MANGCILNEAYRFHGISILLVGRGTIPWKISARFSASTPLKSSQLETLSLERRFLRRGLEGGRGTRGWITFLLIAKSIGDKAKKMASSVDELTGWEKMRDEERLEGAQLKTPGGP